ncbi:hypothetical protein BC351_02055 [Paenibacillus ferrarius]|uniref:Uncharacterized protein n=2 Tax=Paenibacillus ferrarius TaxID=1469647 RepID=A0A1V4HSY3_9BACL|nr:hypothetical protein BC351_02055 [Paenibacillus ferrarius]
MHYRRNLPQTDEIERKKMHNRRLFSTTAAALLHNRQHLIKLKLMPPQAPNPTHKNCKSAGFLLNNPLKSGKRCDCAGFLGNSSLKWEISRKRMHYRRNMPPTDEIERKKMHNRRLFFTTAVTHLHNRNSSSFPSLQQQLFFTTATALLHYSSNSSPQQQ